MFEPELMRSMLIGYAVTYGMRIAGALTFLFVAWIAAGWIGRLAGSGMRTAKVDETLTRFVARFVRWTVLLLAGLACLSVFGVQTTSFAAVIGAAGLAIGLAFQGTLSNFAAGIMLIIFRPFKVGDVIRTAGEDGKVREVSIFTTAIDTPDNRRIIIPNSAIFGSTIENVTFHPTRRVEVAVGIDNKANLDRTREVLSGCANSVQERLEDPKLEVVLTDLGASRVNWVVRIWCKTEDYGALREELIESIKKDLDEAGIGIS